MAGPNMGLTPNLVAKLDTRLVITPQLQQAIKLLALSRMELVEEIQRELEENPALEEEIRNDAQLSEREAQINGEAPDAKELAEPDRQKEVTGDNEVAKEIDWQQYLDAYNSSAPVGPSRQPAGEDLPTIEQTLSAEDTLQDHLEWQLHMAQLVPKDIEIGLEIIGALDDHGYLSGERPVEDIAIRLDVSVSHVERVLSLLQNFDPVGVATRSLEECLLVQLAARGNKNRLAERLVHRYLPELQKRSYAAIAKAEEVELSEVGEALEVLRDLADPRPARNFGGQNSIYITPDIYVNKVGDEFVIVQNEDGLPMLRVSKFYRSALNKGMNGDARSYVQEKLKNAQWLIKSIHQRQRTIYRVMESILKFQKDFFEKGIDHLKPLILKDVAEDIDMHESTISRVTTNKYVHTPQGIFELKYFFNAGISRNNGEELASEAVKMKIKKLIADENPKKPYSDQKLVELLKEEGIAIARRTVAKYREQLGVLSSSKRRKLF